MLASSPLNSSPISNATNRQQTGTGGPILIPNSSNVNATTHTPTSGISPLTNPITTAKFLSKQDREALLQYTKHFTRKAVQIIVQSRLGDKKPTKSRVFAYNADWFNLSIKDLAQITTMTKMSLGNVESLFNANSPFCIEISLRTPENQTMVLETWCISFNDQLVDSTQKVCYSVYKKMSLVLRSLMCITRSTPTYQLSRRQSSDTYVLLYRMYCGEPIVHHLGENYATAKVGMIGTPIGSIVLNLAYRTRLTMTPQTSSHLNEYAGGIQIKDDHFIHNNSLLDNNKRQTDSPYAFSNNSNRYSPCDLINNSPSSPTNIERSPRSAGGSVGGGSFNENNVNYNNNQSNSSLSSLSKRSSSNLNTIVESPLNNNNNIINNMAQNSNVNNDSNNKFITTNRQFSKTQPIPMRSQQQQQHSLINQSQNVQTQQQLQRYSNDSNNQVLNQDESSADEYNSSSVASTPDTIYYFKLKSAAFVPSASFNNNNYFSTSFGNNNANNINDNADLPPFITLLSTDFSALTASDRNQQQNVSNQYQIENQIAQSPPPPQNIIFQNNSTASRQIIKKRINSISNNMSNDDQMSSPCSLPNFKMLDNYNQQFLNNFNQVNNNNNQHQPPNSTSIAPSSNAGNQADDFVFIDSKKIAFGLSNAADDLRTFFRACENAPILESFQNEPSLNELLKDLDQHLLIYESKVSEFDDLIKNLESN